MKKLLKDILTLTELIELGLVTQNQAFRKLRELKFEIIEKFGEGTFKYERLYYYLIDAHELANNLK